MIPPGQVFSNVANPVGKPFCKMTIVGILTKPGRILVFQGIAAGGTQGKHGNPTVQGRQILPAGFSQQAGMAAQGGGRATASLGPGQQNPDAVSPSTRMAATSGRVSRNPKNSP